MNEKYEKLIKRLRAQETWDRVDWFMVYKDPREAWGKKLTSEDVLPIMLAVIKTFTLIFLMTIPVVICWSINKIAFCVLIPLLIPIGLGLGHVLDYIIKKCVIRDDL
jgi:hypothetical protein